MEYSPEMDPKSNLMSNIRRLGLTLILSMIGSTLLQAQRRLRNISFGFEVTHSLISVKDKQEEALKNLGNHLGSGFARFAIGINNDNDNESEEVPTSMLFALHQKA